MAKETATPAIDLWNKDSILAFAPDEASIPAAQKVLKKGGFGTVETTADGKGWWVVCRGITDIYQVSVRVEDNELTYDCTCPSPKYPCKHALALLLYLSEHPEERALPEEPKYAPSDFEALLRGIFQGPEDDTARLVFADFLEENGEPDRALLIRLQCELAREKARSPRARELEKQLRPLIARLRAEVVEPLPEGVNAEFHRGFLHLDTDLYTFREVGSLPARFTSLFQDGWIEVVRMTGYYFDVLHEDHATLFGLVGELDFSAHPMLENALLSVAARYADMRATGRLCRVKVAKRDRKTFTQYLAAQEGQTVADADHPREAERAHHGLTPQSLDILIKAGRLRTARRLFLEGSLGDRGADQLTAANLAGVEGLYLMRFGLSESGLAALANAATLANLHEFGLAGSPLPVGHVAAIAAGSALGNLRVLELSESGLTDQAALELARAANLPHLTRLSLAGNQLTTTSIGAILRSPNFPALALVDVSNNPVEPVDLLPAVLEAAPRPELLLAVHGLNVQRWCGASGIRIAIDHETRFGDDLFARLADCSAARQVKSIRLSHLDIGPEAVRMLASSFAPETLRELELRDLPLRNNGAEALASAFHNYRLEALRLPFCRIQSSGIAALAQSPMMESVKVLDLSGNTIGKGGAEALAKSPYLDHLDRLILTGWKVGTSEQQALAERFGRRLEL
jgi:uncharacterized protein (TIGR02996 family)